MHTAIAPAKSANQETIGVEYAYKKEPENGQALDKN